MIVEIMTNPVFRFQLDEVEARCFKYFLDNRLSLDSDSYINPIDFKTGKQLADSIVEKIEQGLKK